MPRKSRNEFGGAICNVIDRWNRHSPISRNNANRKRFPENLVDQCTKTDWQTLALCLMENHFHPVVQTPKANLVVEMNRSLGVCTARFNRLPVRAAPGKGGAISLGPVQLALRGAGCGHTKRLRAEVSSSGQCKECQ